MHAGLIARRLAGRWRGVLIQGGSGDGKSDLALRALDAGFRLVADDRTVLWSSGGALYGRAPTVLAGLIEARGQGLLRLSPIGFAEVVLAAVCSPAGAVERLPEPAAGSLAGIEVARFLIDPFQPSAPTKLRHAMEHLGAGSQQGYLADPLGGPHRAGTGESR